MSNFNPPNIRALAENLPIIAKKSRRLARIYFRRLAAGDTFDAPYLKVLFGPFMELTRAMLRNPLGLFGAQIRLWQGYTNLMTTAFLRMMGQEVGPVIEPEPGDRRFRAAAWTESMVFDFIKQSYLLVAQYIMALGQSGRGADQQSQAKAMFYLRQFVDAMAPTNFVMTNPEVLRASIESGGENLIRGLRNLLEDLERGKGQLLPKMADQSAFRLGENVATTPGKVVFQNQLMQLIQYQPSTEKVFSRPLLFVPPWINKFYILDLRPENSLVKWAVERGFTVFMVSWINPDERLRNKDFENYVSEGILAALNAIELATGQREVNAVSYCIGGIVMAATLAYMSARGDDRIVSATLLTTLLDFSDVGPISVFIGEKELAFLDRVMAKKGYLEGTRMSSAFNMLRSNDLIWSAVIRNYLLGRDPIQFDLLYWADDNTRMPARMHSFYLRNLYLRNKLREPGGISLLDTPIDLGQVKTPSYFVSTEHDHIAPWRGVYESARLLRSPVRFILGGSGHIAGVINPVGSGKYCYWTNDSLRGDAEEWRDSAEQHQGSWWPDWLHWVERHAGPRVARRIPGDGKLDPIEDAPGAYVRVRIDE